MVGLLNDRCIRVYSEMNEWMDCIFVISEEDAEKAEKVLQEAWDSYCYIDSTEGEYLPICGGCWSSTSSAGVFAVNLINPRASAYGGIGFRSAYFRKLKTE